MNKKISIIFVIGILTLTLAWNFSSETRVSETLLPQKDGAKVQLKKEIQHESKTSMNVQSHSLRAKESSHDESNEIELNADNFEFYYANCLQGEACHLSQNPMALYNELKKKHNQVLLGQYLTLINLKMRAGISKELYSNAAKAIIDDLYEGEDKHFALAEHYYLAGNFDDSLQYYLNLEKKAQIDQSARAPSKVNIANLYFDMGKKKSARSYYEQALADHKSGKFTLTLEAQNFILQRLEDLQY